MLKRVLVGILTIIALTITPALRRLCSYALIIFLFLSSSVASAQGEIVREELAENLIIDTIAPASVPTEAPTVIVKPMYIDFERVEGVLRAGKKRVDVYEIDYPDKLYEKSYGCEYDDGEVLSTDNTTIRLSSDLYDDISQVEKWTSAMLQEQILGEASIEAADLPFASKGEVLKTALNAISAMGIVGDVRCVGIFALSHDRMRQIEERLMGDPNWEEYYGSKAIRGEWAPQDDSYLLKFDIFFSDLPIISAADYDIIGASGWYPESHIDMLITKDGIAAVDAEGLFQLVDTKEPEALLSFDEALACMKKRYRNVILEDLYIFDQVELRYAVTPLSEADAQFRLIPVWYFGATNRSLSDDSRSIFDARTGDILM